MDRLKDVVRTGRRLYLPVQDWAISLFGKFARRGNYVRERIKGDDPLRDAPRAAVFVHFDKAGIVHDYVVHQLCELVAAGYRVTFVSNAPDLPAESRARVQPLCKELIWRFNTGYDFGAYKDGIASIADLDQLDSLILMNDSVYGPFWGLQDTLARIDHSSTDFWGITDSYENRHHIQTFFMVFMQNTLKATAFRTFWSDLPYINHRMWVIRNAEVALTQILLNARLRPGVLAPYRTVAATLSQRVVNPMQYFWDILITDYQCPFIKRDLLTSNPTKIAGTSRWPEVIAAHSSYDITMITRHLKR